MAPLPETLWAAIQQTPQLSTFAEAIEAANLTDLLSGASDQSLTVFAPSNQAFRKFFNGRGITKAAFLESQNLVALLLQHLAPGAYNLTALDQVDPDTGIPSLSPSIVGTLYPSVQDLGILSPVLNVLSPVVVLQNPAYSGRAIDDMTVATGGIETENGYLYVLQDVLAVYGELVRTIAAQPYFSVFSRALNVTGVGEMLSADCPDRETGNCTYLPLTAFIPTNAGFVKLASSLNMNLTELLALPEMVDVVLFHLTDPSQVPEILDPSALQEGQEIPTLEGSAIGVVSNTTTLQVTIDPLTGQQLEVTSTITQLVGPSNSTRASIISRDPIVAYNGIGIGIDSVLLPFKLSPSGNATATPAAEQPESVSQLS